MPNTDQIASRLFKKLFGVAETTTARQFFEEPFAARAMVLPSQVWKDGELIPQTAPTLNDGEVAGVVQRTVDLSLTAVPGTTNAFQHNSLIDSIPFNFGDGSYNYVVKDNIDNPIAFGQGDWAVDNDGGVLNFYGAVPANMPPKISFYKYVGDKGVGGASDYIPEATTVYFNTGAAPGGNGGFMKPYNDWADVKAGIDSRATANPGIAIKVVCLSDASTVDMDLSGIAATKLVVIGNGKNITRFNTLDVTSSSNLNHLTIMGIGFLGTTNIAAPGATATFGSEWINLIDCKFGGNVTIVGVGYGMMDKCDLGDSDLSVVNTALWNINGLIVDGASPGYIDINRLSASPESSLVDPAFGTHVVISNSNIKSPIRPLASDDIVTVDVLGSIIGATGSSFTNYADSTFRLYSTTMLSNCDLTNGDMELYNSTITGTISAGTVVVVTPASQLKNDSTVTGTSIADALNWLATNSAGATKWLETNTELRALTTYSNGVDIINFNSDNVNAPPRGYKFNDASTDIDDGDNFIIPDNITHPAPGRWEKKFSIFQKLDQLVLGSPPAGKDWSDGAITFTDSTLGSEAIYQLNVLLAQLAPAPPIDLTASTAILDATIYQANISGDGSTVTCTDNAQPVIAFEGFNDPRSGNLDAVIDTVTEGTLGLTAGDDTGINAALEITSNPDAYDGQAGKEGFYEIVNATITAQAPLALGAHTYSLVIGVDSSVVFNFRVDDPATVTINNISINTTGLTTQYVSGVPTVVDGENLLVSFRLNNAIRSHYNSIRLASVSAVGIVDDDFSPAVLGGEPYSVNIDPIFSDVVTTFAAGAYSESIELNLTGYNSKDDASAPAVYDTNIRIDMASNESARVVSGSGQYPGSGYGGVFDSGNSLKSVYTEELQMLNGKYQVPTGNYLGNQPIAGEDYNTGMGSAVRWVTFQPVVLSNNTGLTLDILAAEDFAGEVTPDVQIYIKVDGQTGWLDANASYPGVGDPTVDGDPAMVFAQSDGDTKRITFGAAPRTGNLLVRIGLPVGSIKKLAGISISNIT